VVVRVVQALVLLLIQVARVRCLEAAAAVPTTLQDQLLEQVLTVRFVSLILEALLLITERLLLAAVEQVATVEGRQILQAVAVVIQEVEVAELTLEVQPKQVVTAVMDS
jgi:hypothetical protein